MKTRRFRHIKVWSFAAMVLASMSLNAEPATAETKAVDIRETLKSAEWQREGEGQWLSPVRTPEVPFDELIYSWQVQLPPKQGFRLYLRVGIDGAQSEWLYAGFWGDVKLQESRRNPTFEHGKIDLDQLLLDTEATTYQFKLVSEGSEPLTVLPSLHVITTDNPEKKPAAPKLEYPILDLPFRKQEDSNGVYIKDRCQSAAVATAMQYFGRNIPLEDILPYTWDPEYEYPGIWPRTLGAATQFGFTAYIDRFRNWEDVRRTVAENKVILCSITMPAKPGFYTAPPYEKIGGHIVALNGITEDGRVIVTDSAIADNGRGYRCQWLKEDFEKIWMDNKGGVGMVICPPEGAEMKVITDLPRFPRPYERELPPLEPAQ